MEKIRGRVTVRLLAALAVSMAALASAAPAQGVEIGVRVKIA